jgi:hypothetical protein
VGPSIHHHASRKVRPDRISHQIFTRTKCLAPICLVWDTPQARAVFKPHLTLSFSTVIPLALIYLIGFILILLSNLVTLFLRTIFVLNFIKCVAFKSLILSLILILFQVFLIIIIIMLIAIYNKVIKNNILSENERNSSNDKFERDFGCF